MQQSELRGKTGEEGLMSVEKLDELPRCSWVTDSLLAAYHDGEWGTCPQTDARWFECLTLETFQAGLSWKTILKKREGFREAFRGFDVNTVASFGDTDIQRLLDDANIVRNRRKIHAAVENARIVQGKIQQFGSLDAYFKHLQATHETAEGLLAELTFVFRAVGRTTAESIAFAAGLLPPPHDHNCFKNRSSSVSSPESVLR